MSCWDFTYLTVLFHLGMEGFNEDTVNNVCVDTKECSDPTLNLCVT